MIRVVRRHSPAATIFIAGFSGLHGSRRKAALSAQVDSWIVERHIFRELDQALGLQCLERTGQQHQWTRNTKRTGDIGMPWYNLTSRKGFRVLDRMNVWGDRRIDGLHPIFAAQRGRLVCSCCSMASALVTRALALATCHISVAIEFYVYALSRLSWGFMSSNSKF